MEPSIQKHAKGAGAETACLAYGLWEQAGRPTGRDQEFWLEAERQIASANAAQSARPASSRAPKSRPQIDRAAEEKPADWPLPPMVKRDGRSSAKSTASGVEARRPRAAAA